MPPRPRATPQTQLTAFTAAVIALPVLRLGYHGDLVFFSAALVVVATGALTLRTLLSRTMPSGQLGRFGVYGCAVAATTGESITASFYELADPRPGPATHSTAIGLMFDVLAGAVSLWAFLLVRAWVSRGIREHLPRRPARLTITRCAAVAAAAGVAALVLCDADMVLTTFQVWFGGTWNEDMHPTSGTSTEWAFEIGHMSLAGLVEEPVFTGIALLLFPCAHRRPGMFFKVAAATSFARTLIHVYYASGQTHRTATLVAVLIWCAIWSTAVLAFLCYSKSLAGVVIGHGLADLTSSRD